MALGMVRTAVENATSIAAMILPPRRHHREDGGRGGSAGRVGAGAKADGTASTR